jgi:hypothetical protein
MAALDDLPRPGKAPTITVEAKAWLVSLACDKVKDHCFPTFDRAGNQSVPLKPPWAGHDR